MTTIERIVFATTVCAVWILILGDLTDLPGAHAETAKAPDRYMSHILHELVSKAVNGQEPDRLEGYDELETRLKAILSSVVQVVPRTESGPSRQEITSALASCRIVGTVSERTGHMDARLKC